MYKYKLNNIVKYVNIQKILINSHLKIVYSEMSKLCISVLTKIIGNRTKTKL